MKNKRILLTGAACLIAGVVSAQNTIQREVDVTRAFEPSVQNALKLNIMPDMTDTTQMRPDFNYEITPRPLVYGFAVNPLTPARFSEIRNVERYPFYAKAGVGFPMQSVADLRYAKALNDQLDFGVYASHTGRFAKIENDMNIKEKATSTDNRTGIFLDFRPADDFTIGAEAGYDFRSVRRYGYFFEQADPTFDTADEYMKQYYNDVRFNIAAGNSFTDLSKLNFKLSAGISYFTDRYDYNQFQWNTTAWFGFRAGYDSFLKIGLDYTGTNGQGNFKDYSGGLGRAGLLYSFDNGELRFKLGAYAGVTSTQMTVGTEKTDETKAAFVPELLLEKDFADGSLTPFIDVRGGYIDNSYGALAKRNPYLYSGQYALNTLNYTGQAGIKGTLGGNFKYKVYGGYTLRKDAVFWANAYSGYSSASNGASQVFYGNAGNVFTVLTDDLNYFEVGAEIQANLFNALMLNAGFNYYSYSPDTFEEAWGMPETTFNFGLTYNHRNRIYLNLGVDYTGKRQMISNISGGRVNEVSGQTNLKFGVDYFINKQFGVFLQLDNLLNQDIYYFNRYPEYGINGMAGIKIAF